MPVNSSISSFKSHSGDFWRFTGMLIIAVLLLLVMDYATGKITRELIYSLKSGRYFKFRYSLFENKSDIVAIGSSVCETGIYPQALVDSLKMSCWNAGRGGQSIVYSSLVTRKITDRYAPKIALLMVEFNRLNENVEYTSMLQLKPLVSMDGDLIKAITPDEGIKQELLLSGFMQLNNSVYYLVRPLFTEDSEGRMSQLGQKASARQFVGEDVMQPEAVRDDTPLNEKEIQLYSEMFARFLAKGTQVVVVTAPYYNTRIVDTKTLAWLKDTATKTPGIIYLNYWNDPRFVHHRELYSDEMHMNVTGAKYFSSIVAHDIKETLIR